MSERDRRPPGVARHPIRVVARRTGLTPDVLRAWEKRYRAVDPDRASGRRLYSDADVDRLVLLRRATLGGRSIGQIASLSTAELEALTRADEEAAANAPGGAPPATGDGRRRGVRGRVSDPQKCLADGLRDVESLDGMGLESALSRATLALGQNAVLEQVVVPLLRTVGERWRRGTLRIAHEHLVTSVVRSFLGRLESAVRSGRSAARIVIATPVGQKHELGALIAAATAASEGWEVTYLGADLPAEEIAASVLDREARAVGLSLVYPADEPCLDEELRRLRHLVGPDVLVFTGGQCVDGYRESLRAIGAEILPDMQAFRDRLDAARRTAAHP